MPFTRSLLPLYQNESYEKYVLPVHFHANQTHFHMKGFPRGLGLKQKHKVTRKKNLLPAVLVKYMLLTVAIFFRLVIQDFRVAKV